MVWFNVSFDSFQRQSFHLTGGKTCLSNHRKHRRTKATLMAPFPMVGGITKAWLNLYAFNIWGPVTSQWAIKKKEPLSVFGRL